MNTTYALWNIEESLVAFENAERSLAALERDVRGILRTYATSFEEESAYRAHGDERVDGIVVVADSRQRARDRIEALVDDAPPFDVERVETI